MITAIHPNNQNLNKCLMPIFNYMTESGTVLWFNSTKGFGFILRDGLDQSEINSQIFVHISAVVDSIDRLLPKQNVQFEIIAGKKPGTLEALNVRVINTK